MLSPFSQSLYSTVLDEKSNNLLPFFIQVCSTELLLCYSNRNGNFPILLFANFDTVVLSLMYHALTSA